MLAAVYLCGTFPAYNNSLAARLYGPLAWARDGAGGRTRAENAWRGAIAFDALLESGGLRGEIPEQSAGAADPGERIAGYEIGGEAGAFCGGAGSGGGAGGADRPHRGSGDSAGARARSVQGRQAIWFALPGESGGRGGVRFSSR